MPVSIDEIGRLPGQLRKTRAGLKSLMAWAPAEDFAHQRRKDQISAVAPWSASETGVDLEFHQLDCRYETLRVRQPERERRPGLAGRPRPADSHRRRVRRRDLRGGGRPQARPLLEAPPPGIAGVVWEMSEPDALIFRQTVHGEGSASALEQAGRCARSTRHDYVFPIWLGASISRRRWGSRASCRRPFRIVCVKAGSCPTRR